MRLSFVTLPLSHLPATFISAQDVLHPETGEPLVLEGFRYTRADAAVLHQVYGIDEWRILRQRAARPRR